MPIHEPRTLAAVLTLALAAACGGQNEGSAADSPAAATTGAPADTGVRPMNMMDSASALPADSLRRLDSAAAHAGHGTTPADSTRRPCRRAVTTPRAAGTTPARGTRAVRRAAGFRTPRRSPPSAAAASACRTPARA